MYNTFSEAVQGVLTRANMLTSDTIMYAAAADAVNMIHKTVLAERDWPFMQQYGKVVTQSPYTTGVVSGSYLSDQVTGSGTSFTSAMVGQYILIGTFYDFYEIISVDVTNQILTVDPVVTMETYTQPSMVYTSQPFYVFPLSYTLPSNFRVPSEMDNFLTNAPMKYVGEREFRRLITYPFFDYPVAWTILNASGTPTLGLYPLPIGAYQIIFTYFPLINDLLNATDPVLIPDEYREILIAGSLAEILSNQLNNPNWQKNFNRMQELKQSMASDYKVFDDQPQLRPKNYRLRGGTSGDDFVIMRTVWGYNGGVNS